MGFLMKKASFSIVLAFAAILAIVLLSGCTQQQDAGQAQAGGTAGNGAAAPDLCAGISCPNKCEGTTLKSSGRCVSGQCVYTTSEENSPDCGYVPPREQFDLNVTLQRCVYDTVDDDYKLFFTITNLGDNAPPIGSSVWLVAEGISRKSCEQIQKTYGRNQILWGDKSISSTLFPYKGNFWTIPVAQPTALSYKLIYCEDVSCLLPAGSCTEANGVVWAEGSTAGCEII